MGILGPDTPEAHPGGIARLLKNAAVSGVTEMCLRQAGMSTPLSLTCLWHCQGYSE